MKTPFQIGFSSPCCQLLLGLLVLTTSWDGTTVFGQNQLPPSLPGIGQRNSQRQPAASISNPPPSLQTPGGLSNGQPLTSAPQGLAPATLSDSTDDGELGAQLSSQKILSTGHAQLDLCTVELIQKIELPAQEPGPLAEILVREGEAVGKGQIIAKIADEQARTDLSIAAAKLEASELKISSDIAIRYATAGADAADKTLQRVETLARRGAGKESEVDEARLQAIQARLHIEKAQHEFQVDQRSITVEKLEVLSAKEKLQRHSVVAPWGGIVRKIFKRQGEWADTGEPLIEMIQMDRLWVEGKIAINSINPYQVSDRPVKVNMKLANGETVSFDGKIVFVDPEVIGRNYRVRAEVANRAFQNHWLLLPGMKVQMDIDILPSGPTDTLGQHSTGNWGL